MCLDCAVFQVQGQTFLAASSISNAGSLIDTYFDGVMGLAKVHADAERQSELERVSHCGSQSLRECLAAGWSNCNAMVSELVQDQRQDRQSFLDLLIYKHGV